MFGKSVFSRSNDNRQGSHITVSELAGRGRDMKKNGEQKYSNIMSKSSGEMNSESKSCIPRRMCPSATSGKRALSENRLSMSQRNLQLSDGADDAAVHSVDGSAVTVDSYATTATRTGNTKTFSGIPLSKNQSSGVTAQNKILNSPSSTSKSPRISGVNSYRAIEFNKRNLELQYNMKLKRLTNLKQELIDKQKPAIELYKQLLALRKRVQEVEGKELPIEEFKIVDFQEEIKREAQSKGDSKENAEELKKDQEKIKAAWTKLNSTSTEFFEICREFTEEKCNIIGNIFDENAEWTQEQIMAKIEDYKKESKKLEAMIEKRLKEEEDKMRDIIKEYQHVTRNARVIEPVYVTGTTQELEHKIQATEHKLKQALDSLQFERNKKNKESEKMSEYRQQIGELNNKVQELTKALEDEKSRSENQRARLGNYEQKVKLTKGRLKEIEVQKQEVETKQEQLNSSLKKMEDQWRAKEVYFENRQKELQKQLKASEANVAKLLAEKQFVDTRFKDVHEQMEEKEKKFNEQLEELQNYLKDAEERVTEMRKDKERMETEFDYLRSQTCQIEVYNHHFFELCKKRKQLADSPDSKVKSETELALWTELEATKASLRMAEERLAFYSEEKQRFLDGLKTNYKEGYDTASHLLQKEELITSLMVKNQELDLILQEYKNECEQKEITIGTLQGQLDTLNQEVVVRNDSASQEMIDMRQRLVSEAERGEELEQRILKLEHELGIAERIINENENLMKIRDGLLHVVQEKKNVTSSENDTLKQYASKLKDQNSIVNSTCIVSTESPFPFSVFPQMSVESERRKLELQRVQSILAEKEKYIEIMKMKHMDLENQHKLVLERKFELQDEICHLRSKLSNAQNEIKSVTSSEDLMQFIGHVQTLSNHEIKRGKRKHDLDIGQYPYQSISELHEMLNTNMNVNSEYNLLCKKYPEPRRLQELLLAARIATCMHEHVHKSLEKLFVHNKVFATN